MKILGAIVTWNNIEFLKPSLNQALEFCDEVVVAEGCHSQQYPRHSTDGTVEYLKSISHPKLKVLDIDNRKLGLEGRRYDDVQCQVFKIINSSFDSWQPGNWIIQWDDDILWFDEELKKLREILETTSQDRVRFRERRFTYNFRFNVVAINGSHRIDRITPGCYYKPLVHLYYKTGKEYLNLPPHPINVFHYTLIKRPERMNARWVMSIEKGTGSSKSRYTNWMGIEWKSDEDFLRNKDTVAFILGSASDDVNIYDGKHPKILDAHPWRHIDDVRKMK